MLLTAYCQLFENVQGQILKGIFVYKAKFLNAFLSVQQQVF
jgi:hypothetical protein